MNKIALGAMLVLIGSLFNLGAIRKNEDPIAKTQTDPISYKQKLEETKDGPKGAPTPSFNLYPKEGFLTDSAVGESKDEPPATESKPEEIVSEAASSEEESEDWWSEEETQEDAEDSEEMADSEESEPALVDGVS